MAKVSSLIQVTELSCDNGTEGVLKNKTLTWKI